jgi:hypothetical protein
MLYKSGQLGSKKEAIAFNSAIAERRAKSTGTHCISTMACEECFALVSDSICLCIGSFTCPACKKPHIQFTSTKITNTNWKIPIELREDLE